MTNVRRLWNFVIALAFAGSLMLASNVPISAHSASAGKSLPTLKMGYLANNPQWVPTMDPQVLTDTASSDVAHMVYSNLVTLTPSAKVVGDLASHWTTSKDLKTYTFYLRKNARFSDGHPVTAQDVVFSIRRALAISGNPVNYYDALIQGYDNYVAGKSKSLGVKALNKSTVQIKISEPAVYFVKALTYETNDVLEQRVVQGHPADSSGTYLTTTCKANVGSGPFKVVCQNGKANDKTSFYPSGSTPTLTLVPNPYYFGPKPKVKLVLPAIDSDNTAYSDYQAGGLVETRLPTQYISKWKGKPGYLGYVSNGIEYMSLDLTSPPFNNVHCRLAVAYAVDRKTLTKKVLHDAYFPLYTMVPKGFLGYYSGNDNPHFSLTKAKQELAQCPGGIKVNYIYRHDTTDHEAEASAIQGMLENAGIHFTLVGKTRADWLKIIQHPLSQSGTKATYNDWFMDYPDPQDYVDILMHSGSTYNCGGWNNKQFDKLVEQARAQTNTAKRAELYVKAQHLVLGQGGWVALTNFGNYNLVKPNVHGFVGDYALGEAWPANNDWSKITVGK